MSEHSGLYIGCVFHRRLRPVAHVLRYRSFWLFLDLDEIEDLAKSAGLAAEEQIRDAAGRFAVSLFVRD